jgi:hypothetical protein
MPRSAFDCEAIAAEIDRIRSVSLDELRDLWRAAFRASQPPAFTKDLIAGTSRSRRLGGLIRKPPSVSQASRGAIGHEQITLGVSSLAPCLCANTRGRGTPSLSLRMAFSGATPPMPASPPSHEPSPVRTGMDRVSLALGSTRRPKFRRPQSMSRLHPSMGR